MPRQQYDSCSARRNSVGLNYTFFFFFFLSCSIYLYRDGLCVPCFHSTRICPACTLLSCMRPPSQFEAKTRSRGFYLSFSIWGKTRSRILCLCLCVWERDIERTTIILVYGFITVSKIFRLIGCLLLCLFPSYSSLSSHQSRNWCNNKDSLARDRSSD